MNLRCFISIELPEKLKKDINALSEKLRTTQADVKWVPAENLHLTLKFLGITPEEKLPLIRDQVMSAAFRSPGFTAALSGVGVFPSKSRPRVIWIGISGSDEILHLQSEIEKNLQAIGYEPESRPFMAHLTIGRARSMRGRDLLLRELDALKETSFGAFRVDDVSIMKSELKPSGAQYTGLYTIPLGENK